jgi:Tol biopolymer transport system component
MRRMRSTLVLLALVVVPLASQTRRPGAPEDHLPPNISRLTWFGERASWSPDGSRLAFMEKSFGDAYEIELKTRAIRLLTHYPHPGFLRVQFLSNGDYFLIGARTFTDAETTRRRDQEMWILRHDFEPGERAVALDHRISEGVAISRRAMTIAWSNTHAQYPDVLADGESALYTASIVNDGGRVTLVNIQEVTRARAPECTLEAQDFRNDDRELVYTCYRERFADVFGIDLASKQITRYRAIPGEYNEVEGIFPDGRDALVESSRDQAQHDAAHIDLWKLRLEPDSGDFVRMTRWGDFDGYKASNPVVAPDGASFAFQSARSKDAAGVGYGLFLYRLAASGPSGRRTPPAEPRR